MTRPLWQGWFAVLHKTLARRCGGITCQSRRGPSRSSGRSVRWLAQLTSVPPYQLAGSDRLDEGWEQLPHQVIGAVMERATADAAM